MVVEGTRLQRRRRWWWGWPPVTCGALMSSRWRQADSKTSPFARQTCARGAMPFALQNATISGAWLRMCCSNVWTTGRWRANCKVDSIWWIVELWVGGKRRL